jgi:hypothetical protein
MAPARQGIPIPADVAARYHLTKAGGYGVSIERSGESWTYPLDNGTTRTVSWNAAIPT